MYNHGGRLARLRRLFRLERFLTPFSPPGPADAVVRIDVLFRDGLAFLEGIGFPVLGLTGDAFLLIVHAVLLVDFLA